jgi:multiple sugar transport system substrate-binding protein
MEDHVQGIQPPPASDRATSTGLTRRRFLGVAATSALAALAAACAPATPTQAPAQKDTAAQKPAEAKTGDQAKAPAVSTGGGELLFLTWNNFVPEMDKKLDELGAKWGTDNKVKVTVEHIGINDIPTRRAAAITAKAGPDIFFDVQNWPLLFADSLVDVSDIVKSLGTTLNGFHDTFKAYVASGETWKGVPNAWGISAFIYRTDYAKSANAAVPKTWDEFMTFAAALKKFGKPVGQSLGHSFGDPPSFWYPWLWAHGGKEVAEDGKTVAINSPETLMAVEKAVELAKNGLADGVLAWDDNSNNRAFLAEEIGCTLNGNSIYFRIKADAPKNDTLKAMLGNVEHFVPPTQGPLQLAQPV